MTQLRLSPGAFWRLSVAEWRWLAEPDAGPAMARADLIALSTLFPDENHGPTD
ncbi:MAG: phage tail assembly chaperone [Pseudomonadota bacterium]